eukprot:609257-Alexandrium_andersonii.AAC.1
MLPGGGEGVEDGTIADEGLLGEAAARRPCPSCLGTNSEGTSKETARSTPRSSGHGEWHAGAH